MATWTYAGVAKIQNYCKSTLKQYFFSSQSWNAIKKELTILVISSFAINILSLAFPIFLLQIFDNVIPSTSIDDLFFLIIGVACVIIFEETFRIARSYITAWADAKHNHFINLNIFNKIIYQSLSNFDKNVSSDSVTKFNGLNQLNQLYLQQSLVSYIDLLFATLFIGLIIYFGGWFVIVPLFLVIPLALMANTLAQDLKKLIKAHHKDDHRRFEFLFEVMNHIHMLKFLTMETQMLRRFEHLQRESIENDYYVYLRNSEYQGVRQSLSSISILMIVAVGSILVINNDLSIGGLAACAILSAQILQIINKALLTWVKVQSLQFAQENMKEDLTNTVSIDETSSIETINGDIQFNNVSFKCNNNASWIFQNCHLSIKPKQITSISGMNDYEKTIFCNLIMGMSFATAGNILIDNKDIHHYSSQSLRQQINYFSVDDTLFKGTILENLTLFQDKQLGNKAIHLAEEIGLMTTIQYLPKGFQTEIGIHTVEALSQSAYQKILIIRALVHQTPVICFDELGTSLDFVSSQRLEKRLLRLIDQSTLIVFSERPAIINLAKEHYLFKNKQLVKVT